MNLTTLVGEVPRPVSRFSIVAVARIPDYYSSIFHFLAWRKLIKTVFYYTIFEILATATLEKRKTGLGTSPESSQTHSEKTRLDCLALREKANLKAKKYLLATSKKEAQHTTRPCASRIAESQVSRDLLPGFSMSRSRIAVSRDLPPGFSTAPPAQSVVHTLHTSWHQPEGRFVKPGLSSKGAAGFS